MEELENKLLEVLKKSLELAEKTGEFAIDQAPLLLQEFYNWHIAESVFMIITFLGVMGLFRIWSKLTGFNEKDIPSNGRYIKKPNGRYYLADHSYDDDSEQYAFCQAMKVVSLLPLIGVAYWLSNLLHIIIAPKLYLIEYFIK